MPSARSLFPRSKSAWILALLALACVMWAWSPRRAGTALEAADTATGDGTRAMSGGDATGSDAAVAAGISFADPPESAGPITGNPTSPEPSLPVTSSTKPLESPPGTESDEHRPTVFVEPEQLKAESYAVRYAQASRMVRYEIVFNREPDFLSTNRDGAQADSFQFYLDTMDDAGGTTGYPWETVVRGEEIHVNGDVPIRDHTLPASGEPGSGGWGPAAGSVVYSLKGKTLVFSTPFSMLKTDSGLFSYRLELYRNGVWTGVAIEDKSQPLPRTEHPIGRGR